MNASSVVRVNSKAILVCILLALEQSVKLL